jgi:DNA-binding MarR family transcriptional regulator
MFSELKHVLAASGPITVRQLAMLLLIFRKGGDMRFQEIGSELSMNRASVCRTFDALGILGLMNRERNRNDRRHVVAVLTADGLKLAKRLDRCRSPA